MSYAELGCGIINLQTNTLGAFNKHNAGDDTESCTGHQSMGPDSVYRVLVPDGGGVHLEFREETYDAAIYLVTDCQDIIGSCLDGGDCFPIPCSDQIHYENRSGTDVIAYLIVDGFSLADAGVGTLTGTVTCAGPTAARRTSWGRLKTIYR